MSSEGTDISSKKQLPYLLLIIANVTEPSSHAFKTLWSYMSFSTVQNTRFVCSPLEMFVTPICDWNVSFPSLNSLRSRRFRGVWVQNKWGESQKKKDGGRSIYRLVMLCSRTVQKCLLHRLLLTRPKDLQSCSLNYSDYGTLSKYNAVPTAGRERNDLLAYGSRYTKQHSGPSVPFLCAGRDNCIAFLCNTFFSQIASLSPGKNGISDLKKCPGGGNLPLKD